MNKRLCDYTKEELVAFRDEAQSKYDAYKSQGLKLDMSRGKPSPKQLDLSSALLDCVKDSDLVTATGDYRNYGFLDGIPEAKALFAPMLGVEEDELFIFGNASLQAMYMVISFAYTHGLLGGEPWLKLPEVKILCPVPGYDRHFKITEFFGATMIPIPMDENGPDMDMIEKLCSEDESVKGVWCVPQYANPSGISYSDEVVTRFARLRPKAKDFRILWDNAYCIHHLVDNPRTILPILAECKKYGNENMVFLFGSTAKVTHAGAGVALLGASKESLSDLTRSLSAFTISFDKINQMRHVKFFDGKYDNILAHMNKHKELMRPKFDCVVNTLEVELAPLGLGTWQNPEGGYFVSYDAPKGLAKKIVALCREAGVVLTGAGATYPYGNDPEDRNIRIAPSYPEVDELQKAMDLFVLCVKLAGANALLENEAI